MIKFQITFLTDGLTQFMWKVCQGICQISYNLSVTGSSKQGLSRLIDSAYRIIFVLDGNETHELRNRS